MSDALLAVRGLRKSFGVRRFNADAVVAVDDVSFDVQPSECLALVGESGSGKSTTARCVLQLERPDAGQVFFDGVDLCRLRGATLRRIRGGIQAVFQDPIGSLDPRLTIADSVAEPLTTQRLGRAERDRLVREALSMVGLGQYGGRRPLQLSGGQAQRAAIARAIVSRPRLIVLDEAVSSLDVSIQAQILNLLRQLQGEIEVAYLFISHDLAVVSYVSDRVVVMNRGAISEQGATAAVISRPKSSYGIQLVNAALALEGESRGEEA